MESWHFFKSLPFKGNPCKTYLAHDVVDDVVCLSPGCYKTHFVCQYVYLTIAVIHLKFVDGLHFLFAISQASLPLLAWTPEEIYDNWRGNGFRCIDQFCWSNCCVMLKDISFRGSKFGLSSSFGQSSEALSTVLALSRPVLLMLAASCSPYFCEQSLLLNWSRSRLTLRRCRL